jgi:CRISPR-associated protein (TIGR03984 family)
MISYTSQALAVSDADAANLEQWLKQQARTHKLNWLLAHADDGVIWGRLQEDGLHTSSHVAPDISPPLRAITLQQCRLFGKEGELLLWSNDAGWHVRLLADGPNAGESFDEEQIVWGTEAKPLADGFTLLREGAEERLHAVPLSTDSSAAESRRIRLQVRHYLEYDEVDGEARISASRLVDLVVLKSQRN